MHLESWPFGRGWALDKLVLEMVEPYYMPLTGFPEAWSPSTKGELLGAHLDSWHSATRMALWGGEEEGLLGSKAYAAAHYAAAQGHPITELPARCLSHHLSPLEWWLVACAGRKSDATAHHHPPYGAT